MANHSPSMPMGRIAAAAALCIANTTVWSQASNEVVITSPAPQQVSGFGDVPLSKAPFSGINIDAQTLRDIGATRISDALRLDASVTDSYNSPAYWDMLNVRGYTLDNRYNYRREGLPISAETMIPMDNKERIELLKGTSGIQAGTSAPGGLANYVVKRAPTGNDETIRAVTASYGNGNNSSVALDLGARFGENKDFGYRVNAAYENLNPYIQNTLGHRKLMALAMDWRITPDSRLEWEFETSERQQIGINGYSLLGDKLPAPADGTFNITRESWSLPGVFKANTGSVRFKQNLGNGWLWTTQYGAQRLRTDDRLSFAFGCSAENKWDRYCSNGTFDLYDYRSENERRISDALQTSVAGSLVLGSVKNDVSFGVMRHRQLDRMPATQVYSYAGEGSLTGTGISAANTDTTYFNTNRSEYSTELSFTDRIALSKQTSAWLGLRHTQTSRGTVSLDPANPNPVSNQTRFTTPWLALSHEYAAGNTVYASYGEGVELFATPNNASYTNAGQLLGVGRSKQAELGLKGASTSTAGAWQWHAGLFHIERPLAYDYNYARVMDGQQNHQGLEAGLQWNQRQWMWSAQGQWLHARMANTTLNTGLNGQQPLNVPSVTLRAMAQYRFTEIPGLRSSLRLNHEGTRRVLEDGSINLPAWTTLDLAAHYDTRIQGIRTEWTLAVDNLMDQHYWRESPKQFSHYYLYPGAPRTGRITVRTSF